MHACRRVIAAWHLTVLKGVVINFRQLVLMSIAPCVLLSRPAALAIVAHFIAHGGRVTALDDPNNCEEHHKVMHGVRLLGMPAYSNLQSCTQNAGYLT